MKITIVSVCFWLFSLMGFPTSNLYAAEEQLTEEFLFDLEDITIEIATRHLQSIDQAPAIASVITSEQIQNMGARNLLDILKTVPGIGVYQEYINLNTVEVRGIKSQDAEKILIMIDGHRLNEPFYGGAMTIYDDLSVENIKRVEIIRGPGSALYGANAFVAIINVITKDATDIDGIQIKSGTGSFNTQKYNILYGLEKDDLKIAGSFNYYTTDGSRLDVEEDLATVHDGFTTTTPNVSLAPGKTDAWRNKFEFDLKLEASNLSLKAKYTDKKMGPYIGVGHALTDDGIQKLSGWYGVISYDKPIHDELELKIEGYVDQFEFDYYWKVFPEGSFSSFPYGMRGAPQAKERITGLSIETTYLSVKDHTLTGGTVFEHIKQFDVAQFRDFEFDAAGSLKYLDEYSRTTSPAKLYNTDVERDTWALYFQDDWQINQTLNLVLGIRHDSYSDFGGSTNPRAGLIWNLNNDAIIKFLYGQAFRVPNFQELYNVNNPVVLGNPENKPEKIKTYEIGMAYNIDRVFSSNINYFHNEIRDIIALGPHPNGMAYSNLVGVDTDGLEFVLKATWKKGSYAYTNYAFQNSKDKDTKDILPEVPSHRGNIGLNLGITKHINLNTNVLLQSSRKRAEGDKRDPLPALGIVDLTIIGKNFFKTAEIKTSVKNLLDEKYADPAPYDNIFLNSPKVANDFPRSGISVMIEASYGF